ncbi:MAG TPA: glutamine synthetase family protein [Burkholderiales bacterium]|nr:glutamine synthetase family protein [Burkholderiales bacterium]
MNKQTPSRNLQPHAEARAELVALLSAHPEVEFVDAAIADIAGNLRGKRIAAADALKLFDTGMQIPLSLHLMDVRGDMMNPRGRGYTDGDPDGSAWPIPGTATQVWGANPPRVQVLMDFRDAKGAALSYDPRAILERVLARFRELDLTPVAAHELEFYLIDAKRDERGRPLPPLNPRTGARENAPSVYGLDDLDRFQGFLTGLHDAAAMQRVPVSAASKEYAPGQFEANLRHQTNAVTASDHAIFLRQIVKAAALSQNCQATFMAKPYPDRSGSGQHVHVSLVDRGGRNAFDNGTEEGSDLLRYAAGGLAALMAESMTFFAPNLNDYRRFAPDMFAPVNRRWGYNNRSAGLRVPVGPANARRIEHRCAGADAKPSLVMAAVLAGVHYGIVNKIDPGPPAIGNVSREPDAELAFSLEDALARLKTARIVPDYFGAEGTGLYCETKAIELSRFKKIISAEEYEWYL